MKIKKNKSSELPDEHRFRYHERLFASLFVAVLLADSFTLFTFFFEKNFEKIHFEAEAFG